ncbi:protein YIF1B isoform X4 [Periplaneta americana]|uniref:protein YIF1B isoform X4 n=1 Tax=Periplaneta americana TaxID=6978 RepID=UPI0037E951B3
MNYNATSGARHRKSAQKGSRKKRVSDTAAMNAPTYPPPYNPYASAMPGNMPPNMTMYDDRGAVPPPYTSNADYSHVHANAPPMDQGFSIPSQFLNEPLVANVAMQYGQALVGSGKQLVDRELEKYVPVSRLKYYFAVDTGYVTRKLGLLFFPFTHSDWSVKYEQDEPVQPRYEINAPDLYIPTMAYVTYVLVAGLVLGMQDRIIYAVLLSLVFHKTGYYIGLIYCSISLAFFLVRTLKVQILPVGSSPHHHDPYIHNSGNKRRLYILLFVAGIQPLLMWWLSFHLVSPPVPKS